MFPRDKFEFQQPPERLPGRSVRTLLFRCALIQPDTVAENANVRPPEFDREFYFAVHSPRSSWSKIQLVLQKS